ncbi:hypothetical protein BGX28_007229 [Mortierella sp. GBA30]|nr:hypothetical protein BGX28_007229 [Mortierella sp. GBA30]
MPNSESMASTNGPRKGTLSQHPSEMTIAALDNENTPLLSSDKDTPSSPSSQAGNGHSSIQADSTTHYVKIINEFLPWYKRPSVWWILPIFGIAWVTAGMIASSQGQFQAALLCREYLNRHSSNTTLATSEGVVAFIAQTSSSSVSGLDKVMVALRPAPECQQPEIQAFTAKFLGFVEVITSVAIGYYASLSDKHGRRIIIITAFMGSLILHSSYVAMGIYWDHIGLPLMIISGLVYGIFGGAYLGMTMCFAYTADCTDPTKRNRAFSWLHAALFLGLAIGPYLGGTIVRATGTFLTVVFIDMAITVVALLLTVFFMPESLPAKQPAHIQSLYPKVNRKADSANGLHGRVAWHSHVFHSLAFFKPNGRNTNLVLLAAISFLMMLAYRGTLSVIILYTNQIFQWTEYEDGIMFSLASSVRLIAMIIILPALVHFYKKASKKKLEQARVKVSLEARRNGKQPDLKSAEALYSSTQQAPRHQLSSSEASHSRYDPNTTAGDQRPGEATLGLSSDGNEDSNKDESHLAGRHRQTSTASVTTVISNRPNDPIRSPRSYVSNDSAAEDKHKNDPTITSNVPGRTREQTFSDMKFDTWMIRLGFAINSITYIGYGLATETWMFYLATSLHALCNVANPSIKSLLTYLVEPSQFGAALGALQVVDSIATIFSPIVISGAYALTVKSMPEFVWYSCAAWTGICVVLAFMIRQKQFRHNMGDV